MRWLASVLILFIASVTYAAPQSAAPTGAASSSSQIMSVAQQKRLARLLAVNGHDVEFRSPVMAALGLTHGNEPLTLRQLAIDTHSNVHCYMPLSDGGLYLSFVDTTAAWNYRFDSNLKLIKAVSSAEKGQVPTVVPLRDAKRKAEVELKYWAGVADKY
jgi:hypothetical protein